MAAPRFQPPPKRAPRPSTPFIDFAPYEDGRKRNLRFDVNALADFEQETGMGFAQLMRQRAVFASARAMLWAGLKHEDRGLSIEGVGDLLSDYLKDPDVAKGEHTIDTILMVAIEAAVEHGALGRRDDGAVVDDTGQPIIGGKVVDGDVVDPAKNELASGPTS